MNTISPGAAGGPWSRSTRGRQAKATENRISGPFLDAAIASRGVLEPSLFRPAQSYSEFCRAFGSQLSYIAKGNHGVAFLAKHANRAFHDGLYGALSHYVIGSPAKAPQEVIIKVKGLRRLGDLVDACKECKLQAWIHDHVVLVGGEILDGGKITPAIYYSGLLETADDMLFVTVMGRARGESLSSLIKTKGYLTATQYASVEKAVATLWLLGVSHADLHPGNLFFEPRSNEVTIIDFGYGIVLPKSISSKLQAFDFVDQHSNQAFYDQSYGLANYVDSIQRGRGHAWYNPEGKLPRHLRGLIKDKANLEAAREKAWGIVYMDID